MAEFPAMPLWTDAYLSDTKHLTCIEHGAYLLLLIVAWRAKSHTLPNDDKLLARYCGLSVKQWCRIRPHLEPFFKVEGGFWISERLLREINIVRRLTLQRSNAGKANALKRWKRDATAALRLHNGEIAPTPTPIKKEKNGNPIGSEEARKSYPAPPGSQEFQAWVQFAFRTNVPLWRELMKRHEENRVFDFGSQWPPGHKASA